MAKLLLPIILLLIGTGAGIGAGIFLRPAPPPMEETSSETGDTEADEEIEKAKAEAEKMMENSEAAELRDYVKMNNQFVIPVVKDGTVRAVILLGLNIEIEPGNREAIILREPKLRDSFLQVLFDHANVGGFDGAFTNVSKLEDLRTALREIAVRDAGDFVTDVLISDIARQDY